LRAKTRRVKVKGREAALTYKYNICCGAATNGPPPPTGGTGLPCPRHCDQDRGKLFKFRHYRLLHSKISLNSTAIHFMHQWVNGTLERSLFINQYAPKKPQTVVKNFMPYVPGIVHNFEILYILRKSWLWGDILSLEPIKVWSWDFRKYFSSTRGERLTLSDTFCFDSWFTSEKNVCHCCSKKQHFVGGEMQEKSMLKKSGVGRFEEKRLR